MKNKEFIATELQKAVIKHHEFINKLLKLLSKQQKELLKLLEDDRLLS